MPMPENRPDNRADAAQNNNSMPRDGATQPVEFIELGLALELLLDSYPIFADAVKAAILPLDGEFLFELPYAGKPDGKGRVAAVRLAYAGREEPRMAFVFLSDDAMDTRIEPAEQQVEHLRNFAQSFVDVLEKIERH
jgi:hypothetical protein